MSLGAILCGEAAQFGRGHRCGVVEIRLFVGTHVRALSEGLIWVGTANTPPSASSRLDFPQFGGKTQLVITSFKRIVLYGL